MNVGNWRRQRREDLFSSSGLWDFGKRQMVDVLVLGRVDEVGYLIVWDELERVARHCVKRLWRSILQIAVFSRGFVPKI